MEKCLNNSSLIHTSVDWASHLSFRLKTEQDKDVTFFILLLHFLLHWQDLGVVTEVLFFSERTKIVPICCVT